MTNEQTGSKLALALSKAQGELKGAKKDANNPFFKSKYADLASVWEACRSALSKNELAVVQSPCVVDGLLGLKTKLIHSSGEFEESFMPIACPITGKAQEMGSAITYARRYSLAAMVGVAPDDDDDGNAAQSSVKTISEKDAASIASRVASLGTDYSARFYKWAKVPQASEIVNTNLAAVLNAIETAEKEAAKKAHGLL